MENFSQDTVQNGMYTSEREYPHPCPKSHLTSDSQNQARCVLSDLGTLGRRGFLSSWPSGLHQRKLKGELTRATYETIKRKNDECSVNKVTLGFWQNVNSLNFYFFFWYFCPTLYSNLLTLYKYKTLVLLLLLLGALLTVGLESLQL